MSQLPADTSDTQPTKPDLSNWKLIRRMTALAWQYRLGCLKVLTLNLLLRLMFLGGVGFFGLGLDFLRYKVMEDQPEPNWPFGLTPPADWPPMVVISILAGFVILAAGLRAVLTWASTVAATDLVARQIVRSLRSQVYNKMQRLSFRFFDGNESGSLINRVTSDVQMVRMFIDQVLVQVLMVTLTLAVYMFYMFRMHMWLTLACLATTPLLWIVTAWFARTVKPAYRESRKLMDRTIHVLTENLQGVHVVKGFSLHDQQNDRFGETNRDVRDQRFWIFMRVSIFGPVIHTLQHINMFVLLIYGGYLVYHNQLAVGTGLIVFAGLLQDLSGQVQMISQITNATQMSLVGAQRVFEILDTPAEIESPPNPTRLPMPEGRVTFEDVCFGYEEGDLVLEHVDFNVKPQQTVAILGATGSGKSTLLSLIPRFYDPTFGRVLIDGIDAREIELDDLRRSVGLVFQESFLFSNTIAANIAFGHPDATMEQIERAARIAAAHEFIMEMRDGYQTILGEGGTGLSGGQRQRLAIARAVLLEPPILLLDDPTAAIDPETESEIIEAMESAMRGRTTFVVAHRLSTLRRADLVIVLDKGRIVQTGRHEDLMDETGHYRHAASLQVGDQESLRLLGLDDEKEGEA